MLSTGPEQTGFKKGRSVIDNQVLLVQRLKRYGKDRSGDQGPKAIASFDLAAAYDSVRHDKLIEILKKRFATWQGDKIIGRQIVNFITAQYGQLTINVADQVFRISQGVVQGSVLSPAIFAVFLDEMTSADPVLLEKKMAFRHAVEKFERGVVDEVAWNQCIGLKYADDMIFEFESIKEVETWLAKKDTYWQPYGLTLNNTKSEILSLETVSNTLEVEGHDDVQVKNLIT